MGDSAKVWVLKVTQTKTNETKAKYMAKKINRRQAWNHKQRQTAFEAEMGGNWESLANEAQAILAGPIAEFIGHDSPEMVLDRERDTFGRVNMLENSPETYGRSLRQTRQKYAGDIRACHVGKQSCDVELSEVESVIVGAMGHNAEVESMAVEAK